MKNIHNLNKNRAALYDPYLDTLGGGEKHILSILKVLEENGYEINVFWDQNLNNGIRSKFNLQFKDKLRFLTNIFNSKESKLKKILYLKNFDIFIYVTDGSYFISSAKKNFVFCMYPKKELYQMNFLNKIKTKNYSFISNSPFTAKKLNELGIKTQIILPYLDENFTNIKLNNLKKENIILSVGRFFPHLHSKQQSEVVKTYKKIKQKYDMFNKFRLIMVGGLNKEDKPYFDQLKELAKDDKSIFLKPNLEFKNLIDLYKKSSFFWHFTGFGVNENEHPEQVEHLGISPLEAMASGNIVFCYRAGGPKMIVRDGVTGFLFDNEKELFEKILMAYSNTKLQTNIRINANKYINENFNYTKFKKRVEEVILKS